MSDHRDTFGFCRTLDAIAEAARLLSGASVDDVMAIAPPLVLRALPGATRVDLTVAPRGRAHPVASSASHETGPAPISVASGDSRVLALRLALHDLPGAGTLVVSTGAAEGPTGVVALAAELLAVQVESSLDLAHCRELIQGFAEVIPAERDLGVAVGILMATRGLTPEAALSLLQDLSSATGEGIGRVAAELIAEATPTQPPNQVLAEASAQVPARAPHHAPAPLRLLRPVDR